MACPAGSLTTWLVVRSHPHQSRTARSLRCRRRQHRTGRRASPRSRDRSWVVSLDGHWTASRASRDVAHRLGPHFISELLPQGQDHPQVAKYLLARITSAGGPSAHRNPPDAEVLASGGVGPPEIAEDQPNLDGRLGERCRVHRCSHWIQMTRTTTSCQAPTSSGPAEPLHVRHQYPLGGETNPPSCNRWPRRGTINTQVQFGHWGPAIRPRSDFNRVRHGSPRPSPPEGRVAASFSSACSTTENPVLGARIRFSAEKNRLDSARENLNGFSTA